VQRVRGDQEALRLRPTWINGGADLPGQGGVLGPAAHLWTRTELTPADVDFACLYDGFTFNAMDRPGQEMIAARIRQFIDAGVTDLSARLLPIGDDRDELVASKRRTREVYARIAADLHK